MADILGRRYKTNQAICVITAGAQPPMIDGRHLPELRTFASVEKDFKLRADPTFASLVVPNGNGSAACHRWFKYKEAFSANLLGHVLKTIGIGQNSGQPIRMLDPFSGVGTSLLSAQLLDQKIDSIGIECNPFSAFISGTKLRWHQMDADKIQKMASKLLAKKLTGRVKLPSLSSIITGRCITRHMARQIMFFRHTLKNLPPSLERDALIVGLASVIEPASKVRRDGRALRIVDKPRIVFRKALADRWNTIVNDVICLKNKHQNLGLADIRLGDGRQPSSVGITDESIDLILTSPPYPNNIDYNEVYKLELWFLGFTKDADEFFSLRRSTYRSHPTCRPLVESDIDSDTEVLKIVKDGPFADLMDIVIRRVARLEKERPRGRTKVLLGYAYDTWRSLQAHFRVLRPGGRAIYVVGNSLHGGADKPYLVPTDLIFAKLAQQVGFKVEELIIARNLPRRLVGNHFLRDSLLVLRKDQ